jgi:hypothetical protein
MNNTRILRRMALTAGLAALGVALPAAAQASETVEASVPMNISVSGTQHTDWHMRTIVHDGCSDGDITYEHTGAEDLGFHTAGTVAGTLSTVHDDAGEIYSRLDVDPPRAGGALLDLDANTHRDSHTTMTQTGGHESECGGADEDPEPPLGPDCGSEDHTLTVKLVMDRSGNLKVSTAGIGNKEPFARCSTPAQLASPRLAEVLDDTTTTIAGQGDSRVATVVGRRVVHQALPGGEAVTTLRWRVVLERVADDEENEELAPSAGGPAPTTTAAAPTPLAPAPATSARHHRAPKRAVKRRKHNTSPRKRARARAHRCDGDVPRAGGGARGAGAERPGPPAVRGCGVGATGRGLSGRL